MLEGTGVESNLDMVILFNESVLKNLTNQLEKTEDPTKKQEIQNEISDYKDSLSNSLGDCIERIEEKGAFDTQDIQNILKIATCSNKNDLGLLKRETTNYKDLFEKIGNYVEAHYTSDGIVGLLQVHQQLHSFITANPDTELSDITNSLHIFYDSMTDTVVHQVAAYIADTNVDILSKNQLSSKDVSDVQQLHQLLSKSNDARLFPLREQLKPSLEKVESYRKHAVVSQAAAKVGETLSKAIEAMNTLAESKAQIKPDNAGVNDVYLLEREGITLKGFKGQRSKEDEKLIQHLFTLQNSLGSHVFSFNITSGDVTRQGVQTKADRGAVNFKQSELANKKTQKYFINRLTSEEKELWETLIYQSKSYEFLEDTLFEIKGSDGNVTEKTFKQLKNDVEKGISTESSMIREKGNGSYTSLKTFRNKDSDFNAAMNYTPSLKPDQIPFIPRFNNAQVKTAFEELNRQKWSLLIDGNRKDVTFKKLLAYHAHGMDLKGLIFDKNGNPADMSKFEKAFQAKWTLDFPNVLMTNAAGGLSSLKGIQNLEAKLYVPNLILLSEVLSSKPMQQAIFNKLDHDAFFDLVLTGEMQFLDLHHYNLGFAPISNDQFDRFQKCSFGYTVGPKEFLDASFEYMMDAYFKGKITDDTVITVEEGGVSQKKKLSEMPELQAALNVKWKLVLFDTDLVFSESNELMSLYDQPHIPLRSDVLMSELRNINLPDEVLDRLSNSSERDAATIAWMNRMDAPIYSRLSEEKKVSVQNLVKPFLEKKEYTISSERIKQNVHFPHSQLQAKFVQDMCQLDTPEKEELWVKLGKELQMDLSGTAPEDIKKRAVIANQLFPRVSWKQRNAYIERINSRTEYLAGFKQLQETAETPKEELAKLKLFLETKSTPVNSHERTLFLDQLKLMEASLSIDEEKLEYIKSFILTKTQPTYEKLLMAMYPHLADALALSEELYGRDQAGKYIGWHEKPLSDQVYEGLAKDPSSDAYKFAKILDDVLNNKPLTASF